MTRSEKTFIANEIIDKLNESYVRSLVVSEGKEKTIGEIVMEVLAAHGELDVAVAEKILNQVLQQAKNSEYPTEEIPKATVKLNLAEVLFLTDVRMQDLVKTENVLQSLVNVMSDNDDGRAGALCEAIKVVSEILFSRFESRGVNL